MKTYLLLHGAMRGAWLWDKILPLMEKKGARIIAYDLPGHGKRFHERTGVLMSTYINDVISFIKTQNLAEIVLVGHSMSGVVISKVAEEMGDRIRHLVYLAAVVPQDGDALIDLLTKERQETLRKLQGKVSELFAPINALKLNYFTDLTGEEQESYLEKLTSQPLDAFFEKIELKVFSKLNIPRTYIMGLRDKALPPELTAAFSERLGVKPITVDAGHDMMVIKPEEIAGILLNVP